MNDTIAILESETLPGDQSVEALRKYALGRARLHVHYFRRSVVAFWEMGVVLKGIQTAIATQNQGKKRKDRVKFGDFLEEFCLEAEISPSHAYNAIKVAGYFLTAEDAAEYTIKKAIKMAEGWSYDDLSLDPPNPDKGKDTGAEGEGVEEGGEGEGGTGGEGDDEGGQDEGGEGKEKDDDPPMPQPPADAEDDIAERIGHLADEVVDLVQDVVKATHDGVIRRRRSDALDAALKAKTEIEALIAALESVEG